jgi:hypothetical protein
MILRMEGIPSTALVALCCSSASLALILYQYSINYAFVYSKPSISGRPLSRFSSAFIVVGSAPIGMLCVTTCITGLYAAQHLPHLIVENTDASKWLIAGGTLAAAHFAFVPFVAQAVRKIEAADAEDKTDAEVNAINRLQTKTWLTWHSIRVVLVDIPALVCLAYGVSLSGQALTTQNAMGLLQ